MFTVSCNPVMDPDVLKTRNDHGNLLVCGNRLGDKEILGSILKIHHDSRGDIPCSQDRHFCAGGLESCSKSGHDVSVSVDICGGIIVRRVGGEVE